MKYVDTAQTAAATSLPNINNDPSVQDLGELSRNPSFAAASDAGSAFS